MSQKINKRLAGFTIIEILIATLIFSGGLLVFMNLHSQALSYNQIAYFDFIANNLAQDMLDRIKLNPKTSYSISPRSKVSTYSRLCETRTCSMKNIETYDVDQWLYAVNKKLPGGQGSVTSITEAHGRRVYTVSVEYTYHKKSSQKRTISIKGRL